MEATRSLTFLYKMTAIGTILRLIVSSLGGDSTASPSR